MFGKRFSRALAVVTTGTLIMASTVLADSVTGDFVDSEATSITVAAGSTLDLEVVVFLRRQGTAVSTVTWGTPTKSGAGCTDVVVGSLSPATLSLPSPAWADLSTGLNSRDDLSPGVYSTSHLTGTGGSNGESCTLTYAASGSTGAGGSLSGGNASTTLTINFAITNTAPTLTLPADFSVEGNTLGGASVTYTGISASDNEEGDLTGDVTCIPASGSFFALGGPHAVNCSVTDSGTLSDSGSFNVTVVDTTGPSVTAPADITVEGNATGGASLSGGGATAAALTNFLAGATASDSVWGDVSGSISDDAPALFLLGPTTVTFTAIDGSDNSGTGMAIVTVQDTTAPTLQGMPSDMTLSTTDPDGLVVNYTLPTATDIVDPSPDVTCDPVSGSVFNLGTTTVECYAKDASGNQSAVQSFQVTVNYYSSTFLAPINGTPVTNKVKGGRVIPVKVEVFKNFIEDEGTGPVTLQLYKSNGCSTTSVDDVEETVASGSANSGTNFRWEPDGGYWIYNLKTPTAQACYVGIVTLDGSEAGRFLLTVTK